MCSGDAPEMEDKGNFVGRWMDILRPGFERISHIGDEATQIAELEKQAVLVSLENLMTFPFVKEAVDDERLTLHGLWTEIGAGTLEHYDAASNTFVTV